MTSDFCIAVHAVVYLDHKGCSLSSEQLADNICTNAARVRKVMAKLKAAGLIETKEGIEGGYSFTGTASGTTLAVIACALDVRFAEMNWFSGDPDKDCLVSSGMAGAMESLTAELDSSCMKTLEKKTNADIENQLFENKGDRHGKV